MILFPPLQPLLRWLANRFPDAKLRRLLDASQSVIKTSDGVLQRERTRLAAGGLDLPSGGPDPSSGRLHPSSLRSAGVRVDAGGADDGLKGVASKGVKPGSFFQIAMQAKRRDDGEPFLDMDLCQQVGLALGFRGLGEVLKSTP